MKKTEKYLNFFGDSGNYKFHNPLPNPYGLRGNPDFNANSYDQGDGLNGTPDYSSFTGEVQDDAWSNHPGFISAWFGKKNDCPTGQVYDENLPGCVLDTNIVIDGNNPGATTATTDPKKGGFISAWFDGNKKYYKCELGQTVTKEFPKGQQPVGWETYKNPCLTATQRKEKKDNFWGGFGDALAGLSTGYKSGLESYNPQGITGPQFDPNATNTNTTSASVGGNVGKTVGWVLVGLVGVGLLYMVVKAGSSGGGGSTDDYISRV